MSIPSQISKRNGQKVTFDPEKITQAIFRAGDQTGEYVFDDAVKLTEKVLKKLEGYKKISVEEVQDIVEEVLMTSSYLKTAKAYILYREKRNEGRRRNLFQPRLNLKPYEYPELNEYKEAIQHSYWLHTEFNYTSDIHDFHVNTSDAEQNAIKNSMLAIAQVEVAVKDFWGDIRHRMPKPEVSSVGYTFAESEVRHHDAYAHLLEILGLNEEFEKIREIPALIERVDYLESNKNFAKTESDRDYTISVLLFSLFIEHVSLFSQFLVIMSFNKHRNLFKGMSNAIEATSKEEQIHGLFGIDLINLIREEHPEWFDKEMEEIVLTECLQAYASEEKVIDWIYEKGDLDFLPKDTVKEFVKNRLNNSLESIGYERIFEVDEQAVEETDWFDDEVIATKHVDFFVKRSINYSKRARSISSDDLF